MAKSLLATQHGRPAVALSLWPHTVVRTFWGFGGIPGLASTPSRMRRANAAACTKSGVRALSVSVAWAVVFLCLFLLFLLLLLFLLFLLFLFLLFLWC